MLLQVRLYALGLYPTIPDGTFDMATENAVRDLQSQLGQDNDGEVTRQTWEAVVYLEQQYGVNYQYQSPYDALAQLQFDRERPELSSGQYRSEPGSMSEDGQWQWDGSSWQSVGEPPAQDSYVGQLSPDGHWQWDGNDWQPAGGEQVAVHDSYIGQLSPDGYWRWDGQEWQVA